MERLLTRKEAAEFLGFQPQTLNRWTWMGKGPKLTKLGRLVRYKLADLEEWVADNSAASTPHVAEAAPAKVASIGPRVVIDGQAYYTEEAVNKMMDRLGVKLLLSWSPDEASAVGAA